MDELKQLYVKIRETADEAKALANAGDVAEAQVRMETLDELLAQATMLEKVEAKMKFLGAPVKDVPLPGAEEGEGQAAGTPPDAGQEAMKSIYTIRYGSDETATDAVLMDLHGASYKQQRLAQWQAFTRYLRNARQEPDSTDHKLLKQVILTPDVALDAIKQGIEVKTMKDVMVEAVDTLGGYIVPVDFNTDVIRRLQGFAVMRGRARTMTTSRDRVELPKLTGGDIQYPTNVRVTWVDETPTAGTADTNLTWGVEAINVHTVMAETFLSRNLVEDAAFNIVNELTQSFAESAAIDEDNRFLTGNGVGVPQGIIPGGTAPLTGVSTANTGHATELTWDGLIDLLYSIGSQYRNNATWIMERLTVAEIRKLKAGTGEYLWEPDQQVGQPANLMGFPVLEQETMPSIAAGTYPILFGDPRGYRIVDRVGMSVERYLDSSTARINQVIYIMRRRLGGQLVEPWRWAAQLVSA